MLEVADTAAHLPCVCRHVCHHILYFEPCLCTPEEKLVQAEVMENALVTVILVCLSPML